MSDIEISINKRSKEAPDNLKDNNNKISATDRKSTHGNKPIPEIKGRVIELKKQVQHVKTPSSYQNTNEVIKNGDENKAGQYSQLDSLINSEYFDFTSDDDFGEMSVKTSQPNHSNKSQQASEYFNSYNNGEKHRNKENQEISHKRLKENTETSKNSPKNENNNSKSSNISQISEKIYNDVMNKQVNINETKIPERIEFYFPFPPYPSQKLMIKTLITSFINSTNTIIESPTGTGKTLTMCAAIDSYLNLDHEPNKLLKTFTTDPQAQKIYILSRTHTQLKQIHRCLNENYNISVTTLGSRKSYCLKQVDNNTCRNLRKKNHCKYFLGVSKMVKKVLNSEAAPEYVDDSVEKRRMPFPLNIEHPKNSNKEVSVPKFDIESLNKFGMKCNGCPYYVSRELNTSSVVTLAPYNYLFDPMISRSTSLELNKSIIIIDEAHNIDGVCRDSGSLTLTMTDMENMTQELYYWYRKEPKTWHFSETIKLIRKYRQHEIGVFTGNEIERHTELLNKAGVELANIKELELEHEQHLTTFNFVLNLLSRHPDTYSLKVEKEDGIYRVQFYLNDPSVIFNEIKQKARSIILLSGTMSPFDLIKNELLLKCDTKIMLHVLDKNRLKVYNISVSQGGQQLKGTFANINEDWFINEIINSIQVARFHLEKAKLEGGILIFLPSYNLVRKIKDRMKLAHCFYESDDTAMDRYSKSLRYNPALLAVYRGKLSEGMDFKDSLCRVLIAVGVPYPQFKDVCIVEKRKFNDTHAKPNEQRRTLSGSTWYEGQALKAVNQAIGRIIRHKDDFGIVFLLDCRWGYLRKNLSKWIRESIVKSGRLSEFNKDIMATVEYFKSL